MNKDSSSALTKKRRWDDKALVKQSDVPLAKKIRRPQTVLDEDTYLDGLSQIIARDFFPGLAAVDAQRDFLDALDSHNDAWIQEASTRVNSTLDFGQAWARRGVQLADRTAAKIIASSPASSTPRNYVGDTPRAAKASESFGQGPPPDLRLSLGAYQAKYTSEDNESFNALLDRQNQHNRDKHAYLFAGNQLPSARQIAWREREARLQEAAQSSMDLALYRRDTRPAMPHFKQSAPRNALMFLPDSIEAMHETVAQAAEAASKAAPRAIAYYNTRLSHGQSTRASSVPASPSLTAINDAVAGRPRPSSTEAGYDTPRVAGYAFVDAEPTTEEQQAYKTRENSQASDPMATLSRITKASTSSSSPFTVSEASNRERLHHKMVDRINQSHRANSSQPMRGSPSGSRHAQSSTPKFLSAPKRDAGHLTPAGRLLYSKFASKGQKMSDKTGISDFDITPRPLREKRAALMPGLTPRHVRETKD